MASFTPHDEQDNTPCADPGTTLTPLTPAETSAPLGIDEQKSRVADMQWNIQGSFSSNANTFPGGIKSYLNAALQLYSAPPLIASSRGAKEAERDLKLCNTPTNNAFNSGCGVAPGLRVANKHQWEDQFNQTHDGQRDSREFFAHCKAK